MSGFLRLLLTVLASGVALASCVSRYELAAFWNRLSGDGYVLDGLSREVPRGRMATCPEDLETIEYRGESLAYAAPVRVVPEFADKLRAFERLTVDLAIAYYGRAPDRLLHFGARVCRSVRGRSQRLSEHALANALDVSGFQFDRVRDPAKAGQVGPDAFTVSVRKHWVQGTGSNAAVHAEFLRMLVGRVIAKRLFRGVIGPGHEGHADHFHFDQAPWTYSLM